MRPGHQGCSKRPAPRKHQDRWSHLALSRWLRPSQRLALLRWLRLSRWLALEMGIHTPVRYSSDMDPEGEKSALVLNLCKQVGASTYLSGPHGQDYLDEKAVWEAGIAVEYHEHPPGISAIDRLMRHG